MEGEPGAGQLPFGIVPGQAVDPGRLGIRQPDGREAGGAGQPGDGRHDDSAGVYLQVSTGDAVVSGARAGSRHRERAVIPVFPGQGVPEGDGADLGQGGQEGVAVQALPGADLGLVPPERVLPAPETGFNLPLLMPVKRKSSLA